MQYGIKAFATTVGTNMATAFGFIELELLKAPQVEFVITDLESDAPKFENVGPSIVEETLNFEAPETKLANLDM